MSSGSPVEALVRAGMSEPAAAAKGPLFEQAAAALGGRPARAWFVPGRVEFLGKHTDYAGGRSLLCAVEQGFCLVARAASDDAVHVTAAATGERASFPLEADLVPRAGHWSNYPMTVAARVAVNFPGDLHGAEIAFASDLPPAAGMSSSSALVVGTFMALSDLNDLPARAEYRAAIGTPDDLCGYLGTVENGQTFGSLAGSRGVGTFGGSEDHTAILRGVAGHLVRYGFKPVHREAVVPLPPGHAFVVAASGVVAEKTLAAKERYNRVSRTAGVILEQWRTAASGPAGSLAEAVRSGPDAADRLRSILAASRVDGFAADALLARLDQFVAESERIVPAVSTALAAGDLAEVGRQVGASQAGAEAALGNQVPETIHLAAAARRLGAVAATAFGAGFGGSVWALVPAADAAAFAARWQSDYAGHFADAAARSRFFQTAAGPAALRLS